MVPRLGDKSKHITGLFSFLLSSHVTALKGKLAHNFMISRSVCILYPLDMIKILLLVTQNSANIYMFCIYRGKKILFGD